MTVSTSIVMPVHGREALTRACLDALLAAPLPGCEVIVVDDASSDATLRLLESYGEAIRPVALRENAGYAAACNAGAALARGGSLLFLNNDVEPRSGWLEALLAYAERKTEAAVIGAKLLYPNATVQHAGVVIGQDGYPHNLYAGLPAEHPAVNRSRRLQAVTGACMYVRREAFEAAGGFDRGFLNSLEDVDLCLRIGEAGGETHYCHEAVLTHLESASRGRRDRFEQSIALYRERWRERVQRDDLEVYAGDGLLAVEYPAAYPLRLSVSPHLAAVDAGREAAVERRLEAYAGQVSELLGETVRLTALLGAESGLAGGRRTGAAPEREGGERELDHEDFLRDAARLGAEVHELQRRLEQAGASPSGGSSTFVANDRLDYPRLVERIRAAIEEIVPEGASVLVVSRGDRDLVRLAGRRAAHFPQAPGGGYLGHHPGDSAEAVAQLESLRAGGAEYLVLPSTTYWWLEHYGGFAEHLRERYPVVEQDVCTVYELSGDRSAELAGKGGSVSPANGRLGETEYAELVARLRDAVASAVPPGASVLVVSKGDAALLELAGQTAAHFPQDAAGQYAGHHPRDSAGATAELERLRRHGAEYLVLPETARWWLDFYEEFAIHLATHCRLVADVPGACLIYGLGGAPRAAASAPALASPEASAEQLRDFLQRLLSSDSHLVVLDTGEGIVAPLAPLRAKPLTVSAEGTDAARLLERLRDHTRSGAEYLVVTRRGGEWLKRNPEAADELEVACRTVADQRHLCRVFDLTSLGEER